LRSIEARSIVKKTETESASSEQVKHRSKERKQQERELRQIEKAIEEMMHQIAAEESEIEEFDRKLSDPEAFKALSAENGFYERYEKRKAELEKKMERWEVLEQQQKALLEELSQAEAH
jgi:hypothetical protein